MAQEVYYRTSRLSVRNNTRRTDNILESFHSFLRRRIQVSDPDLFAFLAHIQRITTDYQADATRLNNRGMQIGLYVAQRNASSL